MSNKRGIGLTVLVCIITSVLTSLLTIVVMKNNIGDTNQNSVSKEKKTSDAKNNMTEQSDDIPVNVLSNEAKKTEQELRNEKLLGYVPMTQFSLFDEDKK